MLRVAPCRHAKCCEALYTQQPLPEPPTCIQCEHERLSKDELHRESSHQIAIWFSLGSRLRCCHRFSDPNAKNRMEIWETIKNLGRHAKCIKVWIHIQGNLGMSYRKGITFVQCLIDFLHQGLRVPPFSSWVERRPVRSLDSVVSRWLCESGVPVKGLCEVFSSFLGVPPRD